MKKAEDDRVLSLPLKDLAKEIGNTKVKGTIAMGAVFKLFGLDFDKVKEVFAEKFEKETNELNFKAFQEGYEYVEQQFSIDEGGEDQHILINSNQAIALGALAGGG